MHRPSLAPLSAISGPHCNCASISTILLSWLLPESPWTPCSWDTSVSSTEHGLPLMSFSIISSQHLRHLPICVLPLSPWPLHLSLPSMLLTVPLNSKHLTPQSKCSLFFSWLSLLPSEASDSPMALNTTDVLMTPSVYLLTCPSCSRLIHLTNTSIFALECLIDLKLLCLKQNYSVPPLPQTHTKKTKTKQNRKLLSLQPSPSYLLFIQSISTKHLL